MTLKGLEQTPQSAETSPTEARSPRSIGIDRMATLDLLELINAEDATVPGAVRAALPGLAEVVDLASDAVRAGGSIHYFGAGTSGRFGVLDAAEVPPTYGVPADLVVSHLAGGATAMTQAVEDAEDSDEAGEWEARASIREGDVVVGLAASGRTPYVAGALRAAREIGALTVAISSNPDATIGSIAEHHICVPTGAEVVTGSTRMKAGTAQKLVLHSFSTALMVRLGRTYSNLMVDVVPGNAKLRKRVIHMLQVASGASEEIASQALTDSEGDTKLALVMLLTGREVGGAREVLTSQQGSVREALRASDRGNGAHAPAKAGAALALGIDIGASGFRLAVRSGSNGALLDDSIGTARPRIEAGGLALGAVIEAFAAEFTVLRRHGRIGSVASVGIGMAGGAFFPGNVEHIAAEIAEITGASVVACMPDSVAAYVGAIGHREGAVLAAGTGTVALATDGVALWQRLDGLGHLLGDYGSGARLGLRALEIASAPATGRESRSAALETAMRRRFGSLEQLVATVYGTAERSAVLASFVPDVAALAEAGEPVARKLFEEAATELAATLVAVADGVAGPRAVVGGLASEGTFLRTLLDERLEAAGVALTAPASTPAGGAAHIAESFAAGRLPAVFISQLSAIYNSTER